MPSQCCKDTWNKIPDDEPVFILRGQDLLALEAVGRWVFDAGRHASGVPKEKVVAAQEHYNVMKHWQHDHPERCKIPD